MDREKKSSDVRQSGEVKHSIEVTSEMIQAGILALSCFDPDSDLQSEIVEKVYCDMKKAEIQSLQECR